VRLFCWSEDARPHTTEFWRQRLQRAIDLRDSLRRDPLTNAYRLVYAESDGIPGLIVDRYGDALVVQFLTAGADRASVLYTDLLMELTTPRTIYERSDTDVREHEGLGASGGLLRGADPEPITEIVENGLSYLVDIRNGHKTGFYLDQRENRRRFRDLAMAAAPQGEMLNVFSYTGAFTVCGLAAGIASAVNVDASSEALALGRQNIALNRLPVEHVDDVAGDAFEVLRRIRRQGRQFDLIVADPPKFAFTQRDVPRATRGYKDINLQAIHLLKPGGLLFTFSCSGAISEDLFQKIVFGAALDTGRDVQIVGRLTQGCDHPVALTHPEAAYLKGLICRAVS
jgi:23S rRNA (cytosine1962-C5)-methyltransferase